MEMYLWDNYSEGEINEKIKYWVDLWSDLISNFNKKSYGLKLTNPQLLLRDIVDEIDYNDLQNTENKKYFYRRINDLLENDPAINKCFKTEFSLIRRNFDNNKFYLKQLCQNTVSIFLSGNYFKEAFSILKPILLNPNWEDKDKENIYILTQHLIVDLILKGYDLKTVQKLPKNIFEKYYLFEGRYVRTNFPHDTKDQTFRKENGDYDRESFNKALMSEIDNLTIEDRLDKFINYYFVEPMEVYLIFEVEGLKGDIDISLGPVNFYSPKIKKYITSEPTKDKDHEFFSSNQEQYFLNAAVKVKSLDYDASSTLAIEEIEKVLDIFKCFYNTKSKFEVARENYLVVDMEGKEIAANHSVSTRQSWYRWHEALDLNEHAPNDELKDIFDKCSTYMFSNAENQSFIENRIVHSLHWFRKGEEVKSFEDKLVNYWIVIENLLDFKISLQDGIVPKNQKETIFSLAIELIPPIVISGYIYNTGWDLYNYLSTLLRSTQGYRKRLDLPQNIIDNCNLDPLPGTKVYLRQLIDNLPKLLENINREIIKEKVSFTYNFYSDPSFCRKQIEQYLSNVKDDILLLYRYRNKIVHNAHYDNTILPYYVQKARNYSGLILRDAFTQYDLNSRQTLEELFVKHHIKVNELLEKLTNNIAVDLLELKL